MGVAVADGSARLGLHGQFGFALGIEQVKNPASAYTRLVDMGLEPFLVASTVEAVMAQRLVRRLCPTCKRPQAADAEMPDDFPRHLLDGQTLYTAGACRDCRNLGYRGRLGIYELLVTSNEIRQLAHDRVSSWKITQQALRDGMLSLRQDGFRKALKGQTSVDEVARTAKADISALVK